MARDGVGARTPPSTGRRRLSGPGDAELARLAARLAARLMRDGRRLATAESCTGGYIAKICTDLAGSSRWFFGGWVSYANEAKRTELGVTAATLARHGAVSAATAREMVRGALRRSGVDAAVAVTGIAGPDGGTAAKPLGTVWFAWGLRSGRRLRVVTERRRFGGDRDVVRRRTVRHALAGLLRHLPP